MTSVLLQAGHVTRRFGAFTAVDDVSMQVGPGEVVGLLGANGAGKTTLIRMLLGLIAVTSGRVDLLGGPPDRERRRRLGYVPQGLGLYGDLTVRENLSFSARAYGTAAPALPPGLTGHAEVLVRELPLGAQRQVAFLAALAHSPGVLVLDEPTSGVDALARAALWDTIRAQAERGAVAHIVDAVGELIDAAQRRAEHLAGRARRLDADVPVGARPDEQADIDPMPSSERHHLPDLVIGLEHDAAALAHPVDGDLASGGFRNHGPHGDGSLA